eukprot:7884916-Lingulodinium_polyedra.AAC.1
MLPALRDADIQRTGIRRDIQAVGTMPSSQGKSERGAPSNMSCTPGGASAIAPAPAAGGGTQVHGVRQVASNGLARTPELRQGSMR